MKKKRPVHYGLIVTIGLIAAFTGGCSPSESGPAPEDGMPSSTASGGSGSILFERARLILGDGDVIENGALLIEGERIIAVGSIGEVTAPDGAVTVDLAGKTVIPALIDAHAHLGYEGYTSWGSQNYSRENLIDHLERYAYYGFGAVFSAGSNFVS